MAFRSAVTVLVAVVAMGVTHVGASDSASLHGQVPDHELPPSSAQHLVRRHYVIDPTLQSAQVVARATRALPADVRDLLPAVIVVTSAYEKELRKSDPHVQAFVIPEDLDHVYVTRWSGAFRAASIGHPVELATHIARTWRDVPILTRRDGRVMDGGGS